MTDGGFTPDGTFRLVLWFDSRQVERFLRGEVLRMPLSRDLIPDQVAADLLSWRHSGFSAHGDVTVEDRKGAIPLRRYMIRRPIVLKRLSRERKTVSHLPSQTKAD